MPFPLTLQEVEIKTLLEDFAMFLSCYKPTCKTKLPNVTIKAPCFSNPSSSIWKFRGHHSIYTEHSLVSFIQKSIYTHPFHAGHCTRAGGRARDKPPVSPFREHTGEWRVWTGRNKLRKLSLMLGTGIVCAAVSTYQKNVVISTRGLRRFTEALMFELSCEGG